MQKRSMQWLVDVNISYEIQIILGTYTAWTEWSGCKADCENNPNQAVMSRSQTNVANPRDIKTQSIPCKSPCPPGEMKYMGSQYRLQLSMMNPDCSVFDANIKQTPIGNKYIINSTLRQPSTANITGIIMVSPNISKLYSFFLFADCEEQHKYHRSRRLQALETEEKWKDYEP